jgi:hypothetical protein
VVIRASGQKVERPFDINLWEASGAQPHAVRGPVDPATVDIDPLSYL